MFRVSHWGAKDGKVPWITTGIATSEARGGPHTQQDSTSLLPYTSQPDGPLGGPADLKPEVNGFIRIQDMENAFVASLCSIPDGYRKPCEPGGHAPSDIAKRTGKHRDSSVRLS